MATSESANNQDPSLHCAFFGGPRDGFLTDDLPAERAGQKLTGMTMQIPLGKEAQNGLVAVYQCTSDEQVDGF
jgi:hypothetical protein